MATSLGGGSLDYDPRAGTAEVHAALFDSEGELRVLYSHREILESQHRIYLARRRSEVWTHDAWTAVGTAPWAGWNSDGEVLIGYTDPEGQEEVVLLGAEPGAGGSAEHQGAGAEAGDDAEAVVIERTAGPLACAFPGDLDDPAGPFPQTLSETGCYADVSTATIAAGAIPYDVRAPLYSDGALKRRYLFLPEGEALTWHDFRMWKAPIGAIAVKEFLAPGSLAPMETRFLVRKDELTWQGFSYRWRQDGSDADLHPEDASTEVFGEHEHLFPSREACFQCHLGDKELLGIRAHQLHRPYRYGDPLGEGERVDDQADVWARSGLVEGAPGFGERSEEPPPSLMPLLPHPDDPLEGTETRARAYMDANCAHCHPPNGTLKLRFDRPLGQTGLCDRIAPGDLEESTLWIRVALGVPGPMPEIGLLGTDDALTGLIEDWILGMEGCP